MKIKSIIFIVLMFCFGSIANLSADEAYSLQGDWDAEITIADAASSEKWEEKDIIKISQHGSQFVGIRTNGGKFISKNEEYIKGKLSYKMVDEIFIRYVSDPITFDLSWTDGRATIIEEGNKIIIQSYIGEIHYFVNVTLTRHK